MLSSNQLALLANKFISCQAVPLEMKTRSTRTSKLHLTTDINPDLPYVRCQPFGEC